jgi:cell division septation protein DedD
MPAAIAQAPASTAQPQAVSPAQAAPVPSTSQASVSSTSPTNASLAQASTPAASQVTVQEASLAAVTPPAPQETWIVQVAAFASPDRSLSLVQRLTRSGLPAFEVAADMGARGLLYFVRVGPFKTGADADNARAVVLQQVPEVEGAFVRNLTANQLVAGSR